MNRNKNIKRIPASLQSIWPPSLVGDASRFWNIGVCGFPQTLNLDVLYGTFYIELQRQLNELEMSFLWVYLFILLFLLHCGQLQHLFMYVVNILFLNIIWIEKIIEH